MLAYLFIAFIVIISIQCIYYLLIFGNFAFSKSSTKQTKFNLPVSVIICAKNEAKNLTVNIPFFINQNYPNFELVLINDNSYDNTLEVIEEFKKKHPTIIKIVDVAPNEQFWGSKKYALTLGIKAASNEYLLFSDADCKPISENWIQKMSNNFNQKNQIVLGYGAYKKVKKSFLNKLIRFETLLTAIQYFSFAKIGFPYMGVGRNLAYTKTTFFEANGFVNHMHRIKSGDDDLFINQVATKNNTAYSILEDSFTESLPKKSFKEWILQKRRHVATAHYYKRKHQFLLGLFYSSQILFWLVGIILLSFQFNWITVVSLIVFRQLVVYLSIGLAAKKFNEIDLIFLLPFYELFLICIQMLIFIKNLKSKPNHW
ncbi:cellulose synthase/poly-beta-1,6-N-acetylglucosamine synthase-like glycosyltransferase [Lutibacter oceani]|uniref:Cellulose synthase/poly-beta-1,6-N-acetylglucosamine synthase-like glycosyltransferase n=1 Tax=Lutibacter oceani TaxID=1853311 RepID=A0A3D9RQ76_9FLAO|nr:glycosyltransferase [Lutibacter oceani]REE79831.1 cellulose synthase/poly-beta-1,6-N-acetylglucosamine synthase-like glycosyltransferase [Lutibacter oceani]